MINRGFNLVELVVVTIILGILVTIAVPAYTKARERTLDKDAVGSLQLIRSGETIYRMDTGSFYPASGSTVNNNSAINTDLKLSLVTSNPSWNYSITNVANTSATVTLTATRNMTGGRQWSMTVAMETPACTSGGSDTCLP